MPELVQFNPYQRHIFWPLWLISIVITVAISSMLYWVHSTQILGDTQRELRDIAVKTANMIPAETHELLQSPEDQNTERYAIIELYLQSVMAGNPKIDDIYTLRPTNKPHTMMFVVSGKPDIDADKNGVIDPEEMKADLGELYETEEYPALEEALTKPSYDAEVTYDKWGAWISGYAPLEDARGKTVAVVGVDYAAKTLSAERQQFLKILWIINLAFVPIFGVLAYLFTRRVVKPYRVFVHAAQRYSHGDHEHRLKPSRNPEENLIVQLYNNIADEFNRTKQQPPPNQQG
ncbi:MAG: PLDc N-terminal domain-containing protein [Patescibacteria group bacterium]|nr:PLDc N-terminal domain-containing protein [Patescibacteria group bacterium]MDD5715936.1 PLDc N-terminal domain-containing protein [Patescibacteria group bacterium]